METLPQILAYAADALLILASLGAAVFCLVLSRRLTRLSSIDNGLGGAIAVLSAQVDDMNKALAEMKTGTESSAGRLDALNREARQLAEELELMLSACHDLDHATPKTADTTPAMTGCDTGPDDDTPVFGTRRRHAQGEDENPPVPFFLKNRSRLAGAG
ncbi:DUF6468 domain-containing protein [Nioella ostreopsis]|uniref:DUF6468 domain-containing protein n=1 Tax=Nioella ostreopsis TaxID=2448479 RepID=UPI000FDA83AF|nr:DUF6468 domain-containing protein [Nioella ostreopsis]